MSKVLTSTLCLLLMGTSTLAAGITLAPVPETAGLDKLPQVPWVKAEDKTWQSGKPIIDISDPKSETAAKGWIAVTSESILMHIVVTDDKHVNDKTGDAIWMGDSIQFSIDARGDVDRPRVASPGTAAYGFALTKTGPAGFVYQSGTPNHAMTVTHNPLQVVRDDAAKTTTYDIAIPWSDLMSGPGVSPTLGLLLQVNDSDGTLEQNRIYWGEQTKARAEGFGRLRIGPPNTETVGSLVQNDALWRKDDSGAILFAVAGNRPLKIIAQLGDQKAELAVPAGTLDEGFRRYVVKGSPAAELEKPMAFSASLVDDQGKVLTEQKTKLVNQLQITAAMNRRIDELVAGSPHPLFTRHLRSVQAIANCEWQMANLMMDTSPDVARNAVKEVKTIIAGLDGDAADWQTYRNRQRKMIMAFAAKDRSLQMYHVLLPKNWQPDKTYPLVVFLHGGGTSSVALENACSPFEGDPVSKPPAARFDGELDMVYMEPFARGTWGYKEIAEDDVFQCIDDVSKVIKIDPDRVYLTGFSMGGFGTWGIGMRSPDRWAAIVINAGGTRYALAGIGLGRNAIGLPVRISHGDADRAVPVREAYAMAEELRKYGAEPELVILPGVGHEYYGKPWEAANLQWLLQHKRTRPNHFAFLADTDRHLGRNGITMTRDLRISALPWFDCTIEGQEVRIKSEGTERLDVNLGEGGLGLTGDVKVIWNDHPAYEGTAKPITLPLDARTPTSGE